MSTARSYRVRGGERGQVIVLAALSMVALLAMVGLIIDGGNAFAQQRVSQNAADASAEAGAVVLMQRLVGVVPVKTGDDVNTAVQTTAQTNGLATPVLACYTDLSGTPIDSIGTQVSDCLSAAQVGPGLAIPTCSACPLTASGERGAPGVRVYGSRSFGTFLGGVFALLPGGNGFFQLTASATATAIAGYVNAYPGPTIPVTFPIIKSGCDGSGNSIPWPAPPDEPEKWPWGPTHTIAIPLCKNGPGNVGWLDWVPPAGGASELATAIRDPNNPPITTPKWYHISATGGISGSQVQSAMDYWIGTNILLPIFQITCSMNPNDVPLNWSETNPFGAVTDCVDGGGSLDTGGGTNQWYFLVGFGKFHLLQAFINGNDGGLCSAYASLPYGVPAGNIDSCLIGWFVGPAEAVSEGASVGAGGGASNENSTPGVQLIR